MYRACISTAFEAAAMSTTPAQDSTSLAEAPCRGKRGRSFAHRQVLSEAVRGSYMGRSIGSRDPTACHLRPPIRFTTTQGGWNSNYRPSRPLRPTFTMGP